MTGPSHYSAAESDLDAAARMSDRDRESDATFYLQRAQVHATLAHVAAVIAGKAMSPADGHEWLKATDPEYAAEQAAEVAR